LFSNAVPWRLKPFQSVFLAIPINQTALLAVMFFGIAQTGLFQTNLGIDPDCYQFSPSAYQMIYHPIDTRNKAILYEFYRQYLPELSVEDWQKIGDLHKIRFIKKGEVLVKAGQVCDWFGLVLEGTFRFFHRLGTKEIVGEFFTKGHLVSSFASYLTALPSRIEVDALEDGILIVMTKEAENQIADRYPAYYKITKRTRDLVYIQAYTRYVTHLTDQAEVRYLHLMEQRPELLQKVPLYMIASFLGITPEALSRIRKNISKKH